jgi:hypothetical protein
MNILSQGFSIVENTKQVVIKLFPSILVPEIVFDEQAVKQYLALQFTSHSIDHVYTDNLENYRAVYFVNHETYMQFQDKLAEYDIIHQSTFLYRKLVTDYASSKRENSLLISIEDNEMDIILLKNAKLQLLNRFSITSDTDALYFILNILYQYQIERQACCFYVNNLTSKSFPRSLKQNLGEMVILEK